MTSVCAVLAQLIVTAKTLTAWHHNTCYAYLYGLRKIICNN